MDIKETGKKLKPFAPVLSVALVTACVAGSLSGYEAPVYAATQEETPVKKEETKEKKEEKIQAKHTISIIPLPQKSLRPMNNSLKYADLKMIWLWG